MTKRVQIITIFFVSAYLLNFFWETWHAVYLYQGHNFPIKKYVSMIGYVSLVDALLLIGIFAVGVLIWKNFFWFKDINKKKYWYIIASAIAIAIAIEVKGVYIFNQWSYNELMPTVFGIGISPLLQLAVTGLISVLLIRKIKIN